MITKSYSEMLQTYQPELYKKFISQQNILSEKILKLRIDSKLDLPDFAKKLNLTTDQYLKYEFGDTDLEVRFYNELLKKINRVLSVEDNTLRDFIINDVFTKKNKTTQIIAGESVSKQVKPCFFKSDYQTFKLVEFHESTIDDLKIRKNRNEKKVPYTNYSYFGIYESEVSTVNTYCIKSKFTENTDLSYENTLSVEKNLYSENEVITL